MRSVRRARLQQQQQHPQSLTLTGGGECLFHPHWRLNSALSAARARHCIANLAAILAGPLPTMGPGLPDGGLVLGTEAPLPPSARLTWVAMPTWANHTPILSKESKSPLPCLWPAVSPSPFCVPPLPSVGCVWRSSKACLVPLHRNFAVAEPPSELHYRRRDGRRGGPT